MARLPIIRTSERRDFLLCQWRWYQTWRMGRKPVGDPPVALWFGSLVHDALAVYYPPGRKRGPHPAETFAALVGDETSWMRVTDTFGSGEHSLTEEQLVDAKALGISMLEGYVRRWSDEDDQWEIVQAERHFTLLIPGLWKTSTPMGIFAGTYDLVKRHIHTRQFWLGEHKTARAILTTHLPLDPQAGGYVAVATSDLRNAGIMGDGDRISGVEYNFLRKALPDDRPRTSNGYATNKPTKAHYVEALTSAGLLSLQGKSLDKHTIAVLEVEAAREGLTVLGDVSKNQPRPLFERERVYRGPQERKRQIHRLQLELAAMDPIRRGEVEPLKNPNRDCSWCPHFGLCLLDEQGGDVSEYIDAAYEVKDPYANHRKTTEGDD